MIQFSVTNSVCLELYGQLAERRDGNVGMK